MKRNIYIETYGCQMNEYDTGIIKSLLTSNDATIVTTADEADCILLNTCAVRQNAFNKIYARLRQFEPLSKKKNKPIIGILGCMAQNLEYDIWEQQLPLDFIIGPDKYRKLISIIERAEKQNSHRLALIEKDFSEDYGDIIPYIDDISHPGFFLTIMRGCNNYCSFCVVPYTRGKERSRNPDEIIAEIEQMMQNNGKKEVTLLGQNVNSYQFQSITFTELMQLILEKTDIPRIRFTSPHPKDFPIKLIELMQNNKRVCNHIHLPLQSGSDKMLQKMNRNYKRDEYLKLAMTMREKIPGLSITTDIIVGFPGEDDNDFADTLNLYKQVSFDTAFMFKYSERKGTEAQKKYPDDVNENVKGQRLQELVALQNSVSATINKSYIGKTVEVLSESVSKRSDSELKGRTSNYKTVIFPKEGACEIGNFYQVNIESTTSATLKGKLV